MPKTDENFSHSATVLGVSHMEDALKFYRDRLGFTVNFTWKEPIEYAVLKRGKVGIHLTLSEKEKVVGIARTKLYIFVNDVEAAHREFTSKGVERITEPTSYDYGMTDFDVVDPSGNILTFGKGNT